MRQKKAQGAISGLQAMVAPLIGIALVLTIGFLIMTEMKTQAAAKEASAGDYYGRNASGVIMLAMDDIPGWLPIIVVAMIGALILGLVQFFRS